MNTELLSNENINKIIEEFKSFNKLYEPKEDIASYIDHTLLKPEASSEEIKKLCGEALQSRFASVCVMPSFVPLCKILLEGSTVKVCTVIGFPLGSSASSVKNFETGRALLDGASEVDMVIHVGKLREGDYEYVYNDIRNVVIPAKDQNIIVKVILETALLTEEEIIKGCILSKEAGADFVKTSTGFSKRGASEDDIALMRFVTGDDFGVKASGGIRNKEDALKMIKKGATRIGTSAGLSIIGIGEAGGSY